MPEGVDAPALIKHAMDHFSVEIAGGLGPTVGKVGGSVRGRVACGVWPYSDEVSEVRREGTLGLSGGLH